MDSTESTNEWLRFDIPKVIQLTEDYIETMKSIKESLPGFNLNSKKEILNFFHKTFKIELQSSRIAEIAKHLSKYGEDSEEKEIIYGIICYLKMGYTIKNYLTQIVDKEVDGKLKLRYYFNNITFPNRQPLPTSPEIVKCIIDGSDEAMKLISEGAKEYGRKYLQKDRTT